LLERRRGQFVEQGNDAPASRRSRRCFIAHELRLPAGRFRFDVERL
jgi:hypothetical protein